MVTEAVTSASQRRWSGINASCRRPRVIVTTLLERHAVSPHRPSQVLLDETVMAPGRLEAPGIATLQALKHLMQAKVAVFSDRDVELMPSLEQNHLRGHGGPCWRASRRPVAGVQCAVQLAVTFIRDDGHSALRCLFTTLAHGASDRQWSTTSSTTRCRSPPTRRSRCCPAGAACLGTPSTWRFRYGPPSCSVGPAFAQVCYTLSRRQHVERSP